MMTENESIIVTGATCQVGRFLLPRLVTAGKRVHALSRRDRTATEMPHPLVTWHRSDIARGERPDIRNAACCIHLAPLWLLPELVDDLSRMGVRRMVALSSTSRFSKAHSANHQEQEIVRKLVSAEDAVIRKCEDAGIAWTLLRPTMIYGCGMDRNVTTIARFIKRFGFFPLVGEGRGIRQPVHADDAAGACLAALNCGEAAGRAYNLGGGQALTFREMVEAIFRALGHQPRIVVIPWFVMHLLIKLAAASGAYQHINRDMMERVNLDLCFDSSDAQRDFGYAPRKFCYQESDSPPLPDVTGQNTL